MSVIDKTEMAVALTYDDHVDHVDLLQLYSSSADIRKAAFKTTQYGLRLQKTDMIDGIVVEAPERLSQAKMISPGEV